MCMSSLNCPLAATGICFQALTEWPCYFMKFNLFLKQKQKKPETKRNPYSQHVASEKKVERTGFKHDGSFDIE